MRHLLLVLLVFGVAPAYAQYAGQYTVTGTDLEGTAYEGTLTVKSRGTTVHFFSWNRGATVEGASLHDGNVLAVAFGGHGHGSGCGIVLYQVNGNTLDAIWASTGSEQIGTEKAQRTSEGSGLAGAYTTAGRNHNGSEYTDTLTLETQGSLYKLTWGGGYAGVGIPAGDHLAVVYGPPECGLMAYQVAADGTLNGTWAMNSGQAVGTERAIRK